MDKSLDRPFNQQWDLSVQSHFDYSLWSTQLSTIIIEIKGQVNNDQTILSITFPRASMSEFFNQTLGNAKNMQKARKQLWHN